MCFGWLILFLSSVCAESVVAQTFVLDEPLTCTRIGDGYYYAISKELSDDIFLTAVGTDMVQNQLVWKEGVVRYEVKRTFLDAIIGGSLWPLTNGNFARLIEGRNQVELYDATLTQLLSTVSMAGMEVKSIWKDDVLAYDHEQQAYVLMSLVSPTDVPMLLSHPHEYSIKIDLSRDESEIYLISYQSMTVYDRETGHRKKSFRLPASWMCEKINEKMICLTSKNECFVFDPQALPDNAVIGEGHQILKKTFWESLFSHGVSSKITISCMRVFDGMLHATVTSSFEGSAPYVWYPIQQQLSRYVVIDPLNESVVYQARVPSFGNQFFGCDLISDEGKTLIMYNSASQQSMAAVYDTTMSTPLVDVEAQEARGSVNQLEVLISLSRPCDEPMTVSYSTSDGIAVSGRDYATVQGDVIFAPGEWKKTIVIPLILDVEEEGREHFHFHLSSSSALRIRHATTLCIIDDESESYRETALGPYQLLSKDVSSHRFIANFGDSFLMYQSVGGSQRFDLFDSTTFARSASFNIPNDFDSSIFPQFWKRSGNLVGALSSYYFGSKSASMIQFDAQTGNVVKRKEFLFEVNDDFSQFNSHELIDHQTFVRKRRFYDDNRWRNYLDLYAIDRDQPTAFEGVYTLLEKLPDNQLLAIRQPHSSFVYDGFADFFDLSTHQLVDSIPLSFVQGNPKFLHRGILITEGNASTYCYDIRSRKLLWEFDQRIEIKEVANGMILRRKRLIDLETGNLIAELECEVQNFAGNHLVGISEVKPPVFFRNDTNVAFPETPIKRLFFRSGQGYSVVRLPFSTPLPWDAKISYHSPNTYWINAPTVDVIKGATYVDLTFFIRSDYPSSSMSEASDLEKIFQLCWIEISPIQNSALRYSQSIKVDLISPSLNSLSGAKDSVMPLDSSTKREIHRMVANDDYVVLFHGDYPGTQISIYSWKERQMISVLRTDPSQRPWHQRTSLLLQGNRLILGNPGNVSTKPKIQYPGTVSIFDIESLSYLSHFRSPVKNDIGFGVALARHGNFLAVTSQRTPFSIIDVNSPYRPPKYAGKVHVFDMSSVALPRLLRTLSQSHSGFGAVLAMNDQHLYVSAPHATSSLRDPKTRKTKKSQYAGLIFRYPLANLKTYETIASPLNMPLAEFGHSFCLHKGDLMAAAIRGYAPLPGLAQTLTAHGYTYDMTTLALTNWIVSEDGFAQLNAQGGLFWQSNGPYYCPKMGMLVANSAPGFLKYVHEGMMHFVEYEQYSNNRQIGARPMELAGDFLFWSIHKLGNRGRVDSTVDFNQNGVSDWTEFGDDHRSYFQGVKLYEEIWNGRYGRLSIPYPRYPPPPSGTRADWINQEENTRAP